MGLPYHTPLFDLQQARGARFVLFAGWMLPVQFKGAIEEHHAVRRRVGLFDVSHMSRIRLWGPQARAALQYILTNDLEKLSDHHALYTLMCDASGGIVDDGIVYQEAWDRYFLCFNASRRTADMQHLAYHTARFECMLQDVSTADPTAAQLALQGPQSHAVLRALMAAPSVDEIAPWRWVDTNVAGFYPVRISRTGYTGEKGYELYCSAKAAPGLWEALETVGSAYGMALCGLAARDSLRLEMKYPLYGPDINLQHHPLEAGLQGRIAWQKGDFLGRDALLYARKQGVEHTWIGFQMRDRAIARAGYPICTAGRKVGSVTSGTYSPCLKTGIGCGYVPVSLSCPGMPLEIGIRGTPAPAQVVQTPFVRSCFSS